MTTTTINATGFLKDTTGDLVIKPVIREALAFQVGTVHTTTGNQVSKFRIPVINTDPAAAWVAEGEEIPTDDADLGEVSSHFFKAAGLTVISRELSEDSDPAVANVIGDGLARDIARQVDRAFFGTRGASEIQPQGLEDLTGVTEVAAGAAWADLDPFIEAQYKAAEAGATVTTFVANPADALAIAQLKEGTASNRALLEAGADATRTVAGVQLIASPYVTAGTVWGIPRDRVAVAIRQDADVQVDHSVYFTSDRVAVRATARIAYLFPHEAAIQKITVA